VDEVQRLLPASVHRRKNWIISPTVINRNILPLHQFLECDVVCIRGNKGFGNGSDAPNLAALGGSGSTPGNKNNSLVR
jgi:hypothetical protein